MALKRMSLKVPEDMHEWLQNEADKRGLTMTAIILFALETYQMQRELSPNLGKMQLLLEQVEKQNLVK